MHSISIVAVALLQLTSAAIVPSSEEATEGRAIPKGVFTARGAPRLFNFLSGSPVNASRPFTMKDLQLPWLSGTPPLDVPGLLYETSNSTTKLDIGLLKPARESLDESHDIAPKFVYADEPGMVHDPAGVIDQSKAILEAGELTGLPIQQLQGGKQIPDGEYHIMVQIALPAGVKKSNDERERWISPRFKVQREAAAKPSTKPNAKPNAKPKPSSSAAASEQTAKTVTVNGRKRPVLSN